MSVRDTEALVRKHTDGDAGKRKNGETVDLATKELETRVADALKLPVSLKQKEGVGSMTISFKSQEQMTSLLKTLGAA